MSSRIKKIRKRDGRIVRFEQEKITNAILKAFGAVKEVDGRTAKRLSDQVVAKLESKFIKKIPDVESVQDIVEEVLIENGFTSVAKAYILYRRRRTEIREFKRLYGVFPDELKLGVNAIKVLQKRYLLRDMAGRIIETPAQMFRRVARAIAKADKRYGEPVKETEEQFYQMMSGLEFLPNSPTLMNAGTQTALGLSACYVIPVEDDIESIFEGIKTMALVQKGGGGTGFSFSRLRPMGDMVRSTKGVASGPISFMKIYNAATEQIKQGGRRRGANMGILRIDHPDILDFITIKSREGELANFNISVAVTDKFMRAVESDGYYELINPRNRKVVRRLKARNVFDMMAAMAWKTGDPGIIFIDEINRRHPCSHVGEIESTNPCGEVPLLPYESCNLGSINLSKFVKGGKIDWKGLRRVVRAAVHFLDNVIDVNDYPVSQIEKMTKANRKIGLGVMGWAEMLIQLGIPYNSERALRLAEEIMKFISEEGRKMSVELGKRRGSFPNFKGSLWDKKGYRYMRNGTLTTIAPTGTISIIAGTSSGIEPLFAVSFVRRVLEGTELLEVNPFFKKVLQERGLYSEELMRRIAVEGSIQKMTELPRDIRRVFVTSLDISPEWHVRMQAAWQRYTDNAVSKTINLPFLATPDDVKNAYLLAYKLKCKGITIYRYGSKEEQVLTVGEVPLGLGLEETGCLECEIA